MAKWFYYNEKGEKQGPITSGQLKGLAKQGLITPETMVENEEGKSAPAGTVKGLTFSKLSQSKAMFQLTCLGCKASLDTKKFRYDNLDSCPHCGVEAFVTVPDPLPADLPQQLAEVPGKLKSGTKSGIRAGTESGIKKPDRIVISFADTQSAPSPIPLAVPPAVAPSPSPPPVGIVIPKPPAGKLPPRLRRLYSDINTVASRLAKSPFIRLRNFEGTPPDSYLIEYNIRGVEAVNVRNVVYRDQHFVEIRLTSEYPRQAPACRLLTPIFHPNFEPAHICVGDHWTAQERLIDLIIRIGEMIAYQSYNVKSPLNGAAAQWADMNPNMLPTDKSDLFPPE